MSSGVPPRFRNVKDFLHLEQKATKADSEGSSGEG